MGYHRAGFDVLGVDLKFQPRYPFRFVQAEAIGFLDRHGWRFDAVHASPPCQAYSVATRQYGTFKGRPALIPVVRQLLQDTGKPYVIENVLGSPLQFAIELCGAAFGLGAKCEDGEHRQLRRHRGFECSFGLLAPSCQCNRREKIGVYGKGGRWNNRFSRGRRGYKGNRLESREALGIDWMTIAELSEAIPPAYTEYLGRQLLEVVNAR